jgi:5-oxoprolinase (ATP-hydrolysing)
MRFLDAMTATILSLHRATDPYGLAGGEPGKRGRNTVIRADGSRQELKGSDETEMAPGDVMLIETPGGGGYGKAAERREAAE